MKKKYEVTIEEYLDSLNGSEVNSLNYEGTVGVVGNRVYLEGNVVDILDTKEKAKSLFDELFENEFGGSDVFDEF